MLNLTSLQMPVLATLSPFVSHLEAGLEQGLKVEVTGSVQRDKGVGGAGINQGGDNSVLDVYQQLHRLDNCNARDGIDRDQGCHVV
jgi:hypothetical protein